MKNSTTLLRVQILLVALLAVSSCSKKTGSSQSGVTSAASLSFSGSLGFDQVQVGHSAKQTIVITNSGQSTAENVAISIPAGSFSQTNECGSSLAAAATCTINVTFSPTTETAETQTITVWFSPQGASSAAIGVNATLTGTGVADTASPVLSSLSLASTNVPANGTSAGSLTITLKDSGGNLLSNQTLSLASSRMAADTISPATTVTDSKGSATFTITSKTAGSSNLTITDTTDNITLTAIATLNFTGPVTAKTSTISATPSTIPADGTTASTVTVTLNDANGNPVSGKTVTLAGNSTTVKFSIGTASGTSDANGKVTFPVTATTQGALPVKATDSTDNLALTATTTITVTIGPPSMTKSTVVASPTSVVANGTATSTITVKLLDSGSEPVTGKTVTLKSNPANTTIGAASGASDSTGTVTFKVSSLVAEVVTFTATDMTDSVNGMGMMPTQTAQVTFTDGPISTSKSTVTVGSPTDPADGQTTDSVMVTLMDANGNLVSGQVVSLTLPNGDATHYKATPATATTTSAGTATFSVTSTIGGSATFPVKVGSLTLAAAATINFTPGTMAAGVSTVTASPATVAADGATASTVTVTLKDSQGNTIPGLSVSLVPNPSTATFSPSMATTNASGVAQFSVTSPSVGPNTIAAFDMTDGIVVTKTALVTFSATSVSAADSTVTAGPSNVTADGTTKATVTVTLMNTSKAAISGKTVTLTSSRTSDTISAASGASTAAGIVTFTVTSKTAGIAKFSAVDSTDSVSIAASPSVTYVAGAVSTAESTTTATPSTVVADGKTTARITVTLLDANKNPVPGQTVTLTSTRNPATPNPDVITAASATSDAFGIANFTIASTLEGTTSLTAKSGTTALTALSFSFTSGNVSTANSTVTAAPATVVADGATNATVTVTLLDPQNNPVAGKTVTLAGVPSTGITIGAASGPSTAKGIVTFAVHSTVAEATTFTATDTSDSLPLTATAAVTFSDGAASAGVSTATVSPSNVVADGVSTSTITLTLMDAEKNPLSNQTVTVTSNQTTTTVTPLTGGITDSNGVATFSIKGTALVTATLTATDTTNNVPLSAKPTVTFIVGPVSSAKSTVVATPTSLVANNTATSSIKVTLLDSTGKPIAGKTLTPSTGRNSAGNTVDTFTPTSAVSAADGTATFTFKSILSGTATVTLTDTSDAPNVALTPAVLALNGGAVVAAKSSVSETPSILATGTQYPATIAVTLRDQYSNPVQGIAVSLGSLGVPTGDTATISPASGATTGTNGVASFTISLTGQVGLPATVTLIATDTTDSLGIGNVSATFVAPGTIITAAGDGTAGFSGDSGHANAAELNQPLGAAIDTAGNIYVADSQNNRVRRIGTTGVITTFAGDMNSGYAGDGGLATAAELSQPSGVAVDKAGNVFIADTGNHAIREVTTDGKIATVAGTGTRGFSGDGQAATAAQLHSPMGIIIDSSENLYIADAGNNRIRKVEATMITTVLGDGTTATLSAPAGLALDASGNLLVADTGNNRILSASAGGTTVIAGTGTAGESGENGPASSAMLNGPTSIAIDPSGRVIIADTGNNRIRWIISGVISTIAGTGTAGYSGDLGLATAALLNAPAGLGIDPSTGNLFFADSANSRVRKIFPTGN